MHVELKETLHQNKAKVSRTNQNSNAENISILWRHQMYLDRTWTNLSYFYQDDNITMIQGPWICRVYMNICNGYFDKKIYVLEISCGDFKTHY